MATLVLSVILSFLLIVCISFKKYDSAIFLWGNSFQILLSAFCVLGFAVLLYLVLRLVYFGLEHVELPAEQGKKHLQMVGFFVIAFSWLFWILLNYPGTTSGDGLVQLKQFLGEQDWGAAHPPFSSAIMGICFVLGRTIADANFGFFPVLPAADTGRGLCFFPQHEKNCRSWEFHGNGVPWESCFSP